MSYERDLREEVAELINLTTLNMYRETNNLSVARMIDKHLHRLGEAIIESLAPVDTTNDDHPQDQGAIVAGDELPEYEDQDSTAPAGAFQERFEAFFEQGNTVHELAEVANLTEWTVRRAIRGETKPQQQTLDQLDKGLKAFGC